MYQITYARNRNKLRREWEYSIEKITVRNWFLKLLKKFTWIRWPPENEEDEEQNQRNQMNPPLREFVSRIVISLPTRRIGNWKNATAGIVHWSCFWRASSLWLLCRAEDYATMIVSCCSKRTRSRRSLLHLSTTKIGFGVREGRNSGCASSIYILFALGFAPIFGGKFHYSCRARDKI